MLYASVAVCNCKDSDTASLPPSSHQIIDQPTLLNTASQPVARTQQASLLHRYASDFARASDRSSAEVDSAGERKGPVSKRSRGQPFVLCYA